MQPKTKNKVLFYLFNFVWAQLHSTSFFLVQYCVCGIRLCFSITVVFHFRTSIVFSSIFFFFFSIPMMCTLMHLMVFYISLKLCSFSSVFFSLCFLNCTISINLSFLSPVHSSASLHVQALTPLVTSYQSLYSNSRISIKNSIIFCIEIRYLWDCHHTFILLSFSH